MLNAILIGCGLYLGYVVGTVLVTTVVLVVAIALLALL